MKTVSLVRTFDPAGLIDPTSDPSLDERLAARVPHLLRLARHAGLDDASAEDAVQETLVAAWRKVGQLRSPERFDAWIDQICRRECAAVYRRTAHEVPRATQPQDDAIADARERTDEDLEPMAALEQEDRRVLVDRLLGALPAHTRTLVELCYLAARPQREVAITLGLSLAALEARLHRARREMRRLLETTFRREAEAFGLDLQADPSVGWRDTREWCRRCGKLRLRGMFEDMANGRINLRLRCPSCDFQINSGGAVELVSRHSFRRRSVGCTTGRARIWLGLRAAIQPRDRARTAGALAPCAWSSRWIRSPGGTAGR